MASSSIGEDQRVYAVRGFDFTEVVNPEEVASAKAVLDLEIPSDTLRKELMKRVAVGALGETTPEVVTAVKAEIDQAPSLDELKKQRQAERMASVRAGFGAAPAFSKGE
jgi:hypothetical protein